MGFGVPRMCGTRIAQKPVHRPGAWRLLPDNYPAQARLCARACAPLCMSAPCACRLTVHAAQALLPRCAERGSAERPAWRSPQAPLCTADVQGDIHEPSERSQAAHQHRRRGRARRAARRRTALLAGAMRAPAARRARRRRRRGPTGRPAAPRGCGSSGRGVRACWRRGGARGARPRAWRRRAGTGRGARPRAPRRPSCRPGVAWWPARRRTGRCRRSAAAGWRPTRCAAAPAAARPSRGPTACARPARPATRRPLAQHFCHSVRASPCV